MSYSWSVTARIDKNRPNLRIVPDAPGSAAGYTNRYDFWDATNKRWRSGYIVCAVTGISLGNTDSLGATYTSGETLGITIGPPNFNAQNDVQQKLNPAVASGSVSGVSYKNVVAVNYGSPGPSAAAQPDGSLTYTAVDLSLNSAGALSPTSQFTVTVTGTLTWTEISPYSAWAGGTAYTMKLADGPNAGYQLANGTGGAWGMIGSPPISGNAYIGVQLQQLETNFQPGSTQSPAPKISASTPGGGLLGQFSLQVSQEAQKSLTLHDRFSLLFAVNSGLIDANAIRLSSVDLITGDGAPVMIYNLCNVGVSRGPGDQGTVLASLGYVTQSASGL